MSQALHDYLAACTRLDAFNGAVAVRVHGQLLAQAAAGMADAASGRRNALATPFRIASLSKSFTAAAVLKLAQQHALALDGPVTDVLHDWPQLAGITVRQLLLHCSGLGNFTALPDYWPTRMQQPHTPPQLVDAVLAEQPLLPAGEVRYSNTGYALLALLVERTSGQPFADYLRSAFWQPLGLHGTQCEIAAPQRERAAGHHLSPGLDAAMPVDMSVMYGAGSLSSTVDDLTRWAWALASGQVLDAAHTAAMFEPVPGNACMGWWREDGDYAGRTCRAFAHLGDVNGYTAASLLLPDEGISVVVLGNIGFVPQLPLARQLAALALGEPATLPQPPVAMPTEIPAAWADGAYRAADGALAVLAGDLLTLVRDYGVPCTQRLLPTAHSADTQHWRAAHLPEHYLLQRHGNTVQLQRSNARGDTCVYTRQAA